MVENASSDTRSLTALSPRQTVLAAILALALLMAPITTMVAAPEAVSADEAAGDGSVVIAVTGDFGWNHPGVLADHGGLVRSLSPDYVVTTGDNVQTFLPVEGTDMYDFVVGRHFCDYLAGAAPGPFCSADRQGSTNRFFAAAGNHDHMIGNGGGPISNFIEYFDLPGAGTTSESPSGSELYYDVVLGPVHVFVLDTDPMLLELLHDLDDHTVGPAEIEGYEGVSPIQVQRDWLEAAVADSDARWKVVAMHHAPYSSAPFAFSSGYGSSEWLQWPYEDWGVDVVLSGHHHAYERVELGDVQYVINGLGGDHPRDFDEPIPGSVKLLSEDTIVIGQLSASEDLLVFEAQSLEGDVVDRFTIGKEPDVEPLEARASATPDEGGAPLEVSLDGSGSVGTDLTYEWDTDGDGDFNDAVGVKPNVVFDAPGVYTVRLRVTNAAGVQSISDAIGITVKSPDPENVSPPVVSGTAEVGSKLTATHGGWTGGPGLNHSIQWQRCAPDGSPGYRSAVLADSPSAYWRLGESAGSVAADSSGNGVDAEYVDPVTLGVAGALGTETDTAVAFDGTNGRVQRTDLEAMPSSGLTAEMWVNTTDEKNSGLVSYAVDGSSDEFHITTPSSLTVSVIGTRVDTGVSVDDGVWHHLVVTWTAEQGELRLHVDGELRFTTTGVRPNNALAAGGTLVLGQEQDEVGGGFESTQAFEGQLDEVALYPRALGLADIERHHDASTGIRCGDIPGATGPDYTAQDQDVDGTLRVRVTAEGPSVFRTALSNSVGPVSAVPVAPATNPIGQFELATSPSSQHVRVRGWAADPDDPTTPVWIHVVVGGPRGICDKDSHWILADRPRSDLAGSHPHLGPNHGFDATLKTDETGNQQVCVYAANIGGGEDTLLGCRIVDIVK